MTAHELAQLLLAGPDLPICFPDYESFPENRLITDVVECNGEYGNALTDDKGKHLVLIQP